MGLRFKLLIPTLVGFVIFAAILHFYWVPNHEAKLIESFKDTQNSLLRTIEPEITRSLISNDYAALTAFLDEQLKIHIHHWRYIKLQLQTADTVYPIFDEAPPVGKSIIKLNRAIYDEEDWIAVLYVYMDWSSEKESIEEDTRQIETLLLIMLGLIIAASTLWQNKQIISPLLLLKKAVNQFQYGDEDIELKTNRKDEIGELITNFALMRAHRQSTEDSLRIAGSAFDIHEGIIITDSNSKIMRVNKAFSKITGYSETEVIGKNPSVLQSGTHNNFFYAHLWSEVDSKGKWIGEIINKRKNGELYTQQLAINAVKNNKGQTTHYVGSFLDISKSKQQQKDLVIARDKAEVASQAKSEFLATMSHEIRTPMNGVLGMAQLLASTPLNEEQKDYLDTIKLSGQNLLTIINDILDFSKIEAKKMELEPVNFDLQNTSFEVARLLTGKAHDKGLELLFNMDPECPHYFIGDPGRIKQILINLIGNAIKFTEKGHILLDIQCANFNNVNADIFFKVTDTGIGISTEQQSQLFTAFTQADSSTTRKFGGTGLGLSISRQLVELMGGKIYVSSQLNKGSEFSFSISLPVSEQPEPLIMHDLNGLNVLVVDDNKTNLKIIKEQLSSANINSTIIETGKKALALLDEPDKIKYDAIILDYCMPVMDGAELGKSILNNPATKTIPLILLTSAGQRGDVKHFEKLGFAGYLNKPALKDTLLAVISAVVSGSQQETRQEIITSHTVLDISTSNHDADFSTAQLSNAKILLAEDDLVNQQLATKLLNKINIQPDIAVNGIEVLEKTKTKDYDLILMDGQMPEMDGYEATRQLRKIPKTETIPIIALTANAQKSDRDYCIECGMDDFLAKPFSFNDFIKLLNRWLPESSFSENIESEVNAVVQNNKVSSSPVMNFDTFEKLRSTLPEVFENIVKTFLDESQQRVNEIIQSIADDEIEEATMPAHRLKSGSASLGATALAHTAALLESSSKQNDKETSTILSKDLEEIFLATQQAIEAHMTNN